MGLFVPHEQYTEFRKKNILFQLDQVCDDTKVETTTQVRRAANLTFQVDTQVQRGCESCKFSPTIPNINKTRITTSIRSETL